MVEPDRPQMTVILRMRIARWITKATDIHSKYVILIAFPRQQWLRERTSMLRLYVHCLVGFVWSSQRDGSHYNKVRDCRSVANSSGVHYFDCHMYIVTSILHSFVPSAYVRTLTLTGNWSCWVSHSYSASICFMSKMENLLLVACCPVRPSYWRIFVIFVELLSDCWWCSYRSQFITYAQGWRYCIWVKRIKRHTLK
jgi:hypothetical protein